MPSILHLLTVRARFLIAVAAALCVPSIGASPASAGMPKDPAPLCGAPLPSGPITQAPRIAMATLPRNDLGWPELILRVHRQGDRFCYRYAFDGQTYHRAPIMVVHPGDRFAVRVVNELAGPASGATLASSAMLACKPRPMPVMQADPFVGYMNHPIEARAMKMADTDVNMHFHGFIGPPSQENVFLSTLSTPAHACEYSIVVPRTQPSGTYFYHPHAHGAAGDEVAGGLSGMWIVEPATPQLPVQDEHAVILRYRIPYANLWNYSIAAVALVKAAVAREAAFSPAKEVAFNPFAPPPWPSDLPMRVGSVSFSRCGSRPDSLTAVDGVDVPGTLTVPAGEPQLLRILNATSDSPFFLRLRGRDGRDEAMQIVGRDGTPVDGDGVAPLAHFVSAVQATLVPAARVDLLLTLPRGEVATLYTHQQCMAPGDAVSVTQPLLVVRAGAPAAQSTVLVSRAQTPSEAPAARLVAFVRAHPHDVRKRAFTYSEYVLPRGGGAAYYLTQTSAPNFREQPFWPVYAKGAMSAKPDVVVKRGSIEEWYLFNATIETHSFHIHQMNFVAVNAPDGPMTLDTVNVPFGRLLPNPQDPHFPLIAPSVTRVIIDFRHAPRGTYVFHCHMLFHEDRGMMGVIKVV